jgi:tyrosyl-tRNA synthetase
MGKTEKGALFIDKELTPVFDFFQYWRNIDDADIAKFFKLFTFLSLEEIDTIIAGDVNKAKERLALEITTIIHGREEAETALAGAKAAFGGGGDKTALPTTELPKNLIEEGLGIIDLFFEAKLGGSKSDIRRLIDQGGAYYTDKDGQEQQCRDNKMLVNASFLDDDGELIIRAGKKKYMRLTFR